MVFRGVEASVVEPLFPNSLNLNMVEAVLCAGVRRRSALTAGLLPAVALLCRLGNGIFHSVQIFSLARSVTSFSGLFVLNPGLTNQRQLRVHSDFRVH
jgi:hypothetical protein